MSNSHQGTNQIVIFLAYASIININNSTDVHVGAKVTYNVLNRSEKTEKPEIIETNAIKILRNNSNPLTEQDLLFVAAHIDERWRDIGRALNYSDGQIEQFFINNNNYGIKEVLTLFYNSYIISIRIYFLGNISVTFRLV